MVLRYYSWLPLELEPDYKDGYTCDRCHKDFLDAPFYHEETSGTDYCVPCGSSTGHSPFSSLVSSLFFSSAEAVLQDFINGTIALFSFRIDDRTCGIMFSNNANLILQLTSNSKIERGILCEFNGNTIGSKVMLTAAQCFERFPWLSSGVFTTFDFETKLHSCPPVTNILPDITIVSFDVSGMLISLMLNDGYCQVFDIERGIEIVVKDYSMVAIFQGGTVVDCSLEQCRRLHRGLTSSDGKVEKMDT